MPHGLLCYTFAAHVNVHYVHEVVCFAYRHHSLSLGRMGLHDFSMGLRDNLAQLSVIKQTRACVRWRIRIMTAMRVVRRANSAGALPMVTPVVICAVCLRIDSD